MEAQQTVLAGLETKFGFMELQASKLEDALDARGGDFDWRVSLEKQVEDEDYEHTDRILSQQIEESNSKLGDT